MKLSLNWLSDFVKHGLAPEKLAERLTMAGQEVKGIEEVGEDHVFEIEITPNRPDCLSVLGIAREVSAIVNKPLMARKLKAIKIPTAKCDIAIEDKQACPRYIGAIVDNVLVQGSSGCAPKRLQAIGLRPINNIVDITNYLLHESGQPMHAFDYDKLVGGKIIVRRAKSGEKIVTLDGVERTLNPNILVIADAQKPVAIAGIMGGQATEVTSKTKRILFECASFDPVLIRRAGRALGLSSDSSYRFERGVDVAKTDDVIKQALSLTIEVAGGNVTHYRDLNLKKEEKKKGFSINVVEISKFLGATVTGAQVKKILTNLEFKVGVKGKNFTVVAPSFRNDIKASVDIAEEIARVIGYDRLPTSLPQVKPSAIPTAEAFQLKRKLRRVLTGQGLDEAISYPLVSRNAIEKSKLSETPLTRIKNPLSLDQEFMRPSLLPSLLAVVSLNFNRGQKNLRLFEFGKIYSPAGEKEVLGIVLSGAALQNWRTNKKENVDFYDLKGIVTRVFEQGGLAQAQFVPGKFNILAGGHSAGIVSGQNKVGLLGKIDKTILKNWDLKTEDIFFAEVYLDQFSLNKAEAKYFVPLPEFPSITRDVSLSVGKEMPFSKISSLTWESGGPHLIAVNFREQYTGEKIAAGQKGVVFSLVYQSAERTLTETEIHPIHEKILQRLTQELSATIR